MTPAAEYKNKAEAARTKAKQSIHESEREAWLRLAAEWMKLAHTCDQPIKGVMGALSRIYASK
jgi:hypothetical protein